MRLALFDFDGTLTTRDSLMPFLRFALGTPKFSIGLLASSPGLAAYALRLIPNDVAKQRLLTRLIGGMTHANLADIGCDFARTGLAALLRSDMIRRLETHRSQGDTCVLVSASLDLYLEPWARDHGFEAVLCSRLAVDRNGRVSGELEEGNCFGPTKLKRIVQWLDGRQPSYITAYGDSRGDREMLQFAHEPRWVGRRFLE